VEEVFRPEIYRIFSNAFRPVPAGILLPCFGGSRCFPAGSGARNHRPGWITIFYVRIKIHLKKIKFFTIFNTTSKASHLDK
jgi:hypothetical protein